MCISRVPRLFDYLEGKSRTTGTTVRIFFILRQAREAVEMRAQLEKKLAQKEKEKKEQKLVELAQKAREERAGIRAVAGTVLVHVGSGLLHSFITLLDPQKAIFNSQLVSIYNYRLFEVLISIL